MAHKYMINQMNLNPVTKEEEKSHQNNFQELMIANRWVGFDLDSTLSVTKGYKGWDHIGDPVKPMIEKVKYYLSQGVIVKVFTARVGEASLKINGITFKDIEKVIQDWTEKHIGVRLPVTSEKDCFMIKFYDDAAVQVIPNEGKIVGDEKTENIKHVFTKEEIEKLRKEHAEATTEALQLNF